MVDGGDVTGRVGAGAHAVGGHRPVVAGLEVLLAQRLDPDRVLPVEPTRDLCGFGGRIVAGGAVQPERAPGERHVNLDLVLVDAHRVRDRHLAVKRGLGARPHLQHTVLAHPAHRVVGLHRSVREIRERVRGVDRRLRGRKRGVDISLVA